MTERPILFSGEMVKAILAGRKTQTRRVIKPQPQWLLPDRRITWFEWPIDALPNCWRAEDKLTEGNILFDCRCPYGHSRDHLWVREAWIPVNDHAVCYRADKQYQTFEESPPGLREKWESLQPPLNDKWIPSIHMPRWASRITLAITKVRVQRLQDISEEDAIAEGCNSYDGNHYEALGLSADEEKSLRDEFRQLWDSINARRGFSWEWNPWVWAISFKRV